MRLAIAQAKGGAVTVPVGELKRLLRGLQDDTPVVTQRQLAPGQLSEVVAVRARVEHGHLHGSRDWPGWASCRPGCVACAERKKASGRTRAVVIR